MYCSRCGTKLSPEANFCPACGLHVSATPGETRPTPRSKRRTWPVILALLVSTALATAGIVAWAVGRAPDEAPKAVVAPGNTTAMSPPGTKRTPESAPSPTDAPSSGDFADLYQSVESGVVLVRATTCDGEGVGSGFLVSPTRIVTAAHVVETAAAVGIVQDGTPHEVSVIGVDDEYDLALLESPTPLTGHVFDFARRSASAGTEVAVIGHPLGDPLTITEGSVSRVDNRLWPKVQLDVNVSPGNSGGPVIATDGQVLGVLVEKDTEAEGLAYALRGDAVSPLLAGSASLDAPRPAACSNPLGPDATESPRFRSAGVLQEAIATTFANYFAGINGGDYHLAYSQLSPRLQSSYAAFAEGVSTSYDFDFKVHSVTATPPGARVWLSFVSLQAADMGPDGEACTRWSLDYELVWAGSGQMVIDGARGHAGSTGHTPCP